jgi:capsular polysaccharide biosynthesis protein
MQSQMSFSNIASLDPATPPTQAAFPKPTIVLALAFLAGLGLGVLATLIAEALDRRFRSNSDLEFITNAPLLGQMFDIHPKGAAFLPLVLRKRLGGPKPPTPAAQA